MKNLLTVDEHFAFGENWKSFARLVDEKRIAEAEVGLARLFGPEGIRGARFLDIGCGSGLSSLAALRLGAAIVEAVDIDPVSVAATRETLKARAPRDDWAARVQSVFDLSPGRDGQFDIVYSWGVLHHTGDMWRAVEYAASMVANGGLLAIALYGKTPACGFWRPEKRFYSRAPRFMQAVIATTFKAVVILRMLRAGQNPVKQTRERVTMRGMSWSHDIHDWLGGYPYESASPDEVHALLERLGFRIVREFVHVPSHGRYGTGCDEYVARRA
jgi:2-polyprenyl-6-hydroxyphenyl methylase/3-demethylubiquinone-9 3-methyltransferase